MGNYLAVRAAVCPVTDMDRAIEFYETKLGLQLQERKENRFACIKARDFEVWLFAAGYTPKTGVPFLVFRATSIEREYKRLSANGVNFNGEIASDSLGRVAYFIDSEGNTHELREG
ncbi:MAG: VOC family protein [Dehalococcoidia bacterium]